jgi:hypothetical protein
MEPDRRSKDREHGRRWRRHPFAPTTPDRPRGGDGGAGDRQPREPRPRGGEATDAEGPKRD